MTQGYDSLYAASLDDPETFWKEQSKHIDWFTSPDEILSYSQEGNWKWFEGGTLNTSYLAIDRHIDRGRGGETAIIYDSPVTDTKRRYSYRELKYEVSRLAGALRALGVKRGDRVILYLPMIPETIFAMLACARIGAIHSVVFGGFAAHELQKRIDDAKPKALLTASCGIEVNRVIPYKPIVDRALELASHEVDSVVVLQRHQVKADLNQSRDHDWQHVIAKSMPAECLPLQATDPLYIIYTSGTTGKPKGVLRDNGGHAVAMEFSMRTIYDMSPGDVFWAASDVGWVVGHSYIVYAPLIRGCTTVLYEGKPVKTPDAGAFWRVVEEHHVNALFTAPTAIRAMRKEDPEAALMKRYDLSSLRNMFLAGERCDVSTLEWLSCNLGVPVIDHWWQTESGWPMLANMTGIELLPIKPGSAGKPVCGYEMKVVDEYGAECPPKVEGTLLVRCPLPPGTLIDLWQDSERFQKSYFDSYPGYYLTGDGAYRDENGYFYIVGRIDDVINVAGHRLSTASLEEAISSNPSVAECAVIGIDDALKGQVPIALVVTKTGLTAGPDELEKELVAKVREAFGAVASLKHVLITEHLPKTRSGKVLRSALRAIANGKELPSVATIDDPHVLDEIRALFERELFEAKAVK
ncbi:propionyl-CoA synthetase [Pelagicoccus mobilis]|uniref:Propionyl-CoA synthetase n=2 Tax=Pelagicoccus mobilis TaxID=415221 RepID=A0A934VRP2_9BACT|nr:propionyl-CoA synthetase [Pelagicoccus mobilis]